MYGRWEKPETHGACEITLMKEFNNRLQSGSQLHDLNEKAEINLNFDGIVKVQKG